VVAYRVYQGFGTVYLTWLWWFDLRLESISDNKLIMVKRDTKIILPLLPRFSINP